ncbi:MAG: 4Fe-4S binding protein [Holophagales bacterium]|nr:4Fe-4S binding protein [Holophagales bacterium]
MSSPNNSSYTLLLGLRRLGLGLFLIGFGLFVLVPFLSSYRLTGEVLAQLGETGAIYGHHQQVVFEQLAPLEGKDYGNVLAFLGDVDRKLRESNERLDSGSQIWPYDLGQYKFHLARASSIGPVARDTNTWFILTILLATLGGLLYALPRIWMEPAGIKNNGVFFSKAKSRGWIGIGVGTFLIGFYVVLYFYPATIADWIRLGDPVSRLLRDQPADRWFFYGLLYTVVVLTMGVRMAVNYRHSRYQLVRTASVSFFQLGFAFLIPALMVLINRPELGYDLKNAWPLDYSAFYDYRIDGYLKHGALGWVMLLWSIGLATLVVPLLAFFFGKRWYCSWVCGCGGLAETLGDPYRHLSDKSRKAWRIERWLIHGVLVFAVAMTGIVVWDLFSEQSVSVAGVESWRIRSAYGFLIGSIVAGVVGTGFYPFMGNRVWCRFGCPLAAILGMVQKWKSRFRITTNGGQCISCGNCSTYCEQGIDVRWYAQRGQNIIRSSCVGCGICSQVCPRGVLRLENGPDEDRYNEVSLVQIGKGRIDIG